MAPVCDIIRLLIPMHQRISNVLLLKQVTQQLNIRLDNLGFQPRVRAPSWEHKMSLKGRERINEVVLIHTHTDIFTPELSSFL